MKTVITGGTGMVGAHLVARLSDVTVLSRDPSRAVQRLGAVNAEAWDPPAGPPSMEALEGVDAVFNLAGEPVSEGRWSETKKRSIRDSRVLGTRNLVAGLSRLERKPKVLVSASAVGIYGDRGDEKLDETSPAGAGFLAEVCANWEREAMAATELGIRVVCVRIGIVLAAEGGALPRMLTPFKLGAGGRLGSGKQWMSWIHIDDLIGLLLHASRDEKIRGPLNAVAPNPATNADFTKALGRSLHRPTFLPVPKSALKMAFGQMSQIMLASQRVSPRIAEESAYTFKYPQLASALTSLIQAQAAGEAA